MSTGNTGDARNRATPVGHSCQWHPTRCPGRPYGVWWCVRRCTVVLEQRSWLFLQLPTHLPAVAGVQEMAQILDVLMPDCNVQAHAQCAETHLLCAHAVEQAGSALLMLESPECDGPKPGIFWAWVVGYEPQLPLPCTEDCVAPDTWQPLDIQAMAPPQALLVLPFDWTIPGPADTHPDPGASRRVLPSAKCRRAMAPMPLAWHCHAWSQDRTGLTVARLPLRCAACT